jgi:dipeptidyl aminopeptidase/acylaminoacyl peptidase
MKRALIAAAALWACGLGAVQAAPLEVYGKLPVMDQVAISPDGTKIAFVQPVGGKFAVVVDQLSPAALVAGVAPSEQKIRSLIWADSTHLLVVTSQTGFANFVESARSEWYLVQSLDTEKRKATPLLGAHLDAGPNSHVRGDITMNVLTDMPMPRMVKAHPTVFAPGVAFIDDRGSSALISVDLASGHEAVIEKAVTGDQTRRWMLDGEGGLLAQTTYDELSHSWTLRVRRGGAWVDAYYAIALNDQPEVLGLSPDGGALVLETTRDDGSVEHRTVSLADAKLGEPTDQYGSFQTLVRDPVTRRIIGGVKMGMEPTYGFFDAKDQAAWDVVADTFPGEDVELVSWSDDRSKVVVQVAGVAHGVIYAVVDQKSHKAVQIGQRYEGIKADDLAEVHIATYAAGDGRRISAFLTLPNGREPKNLPLIALPHGGPAARDEAGFDWWAQALASRGYAVLQPQFRGSDGFGWELERAGFGEFGRKMQSDLSDGVRALAAKGYIDPKRVCIVGASYGGYAALAGVTIEKGVYRCAVAVAGVADMRKFIGGRSADASRNSAVRYWDRFVGAKNPSDAVFDQISPVRHADQASAPILLIHGKDDTVVPIEQSLRMQEALKAAGKPVEMVTLASEDHWLSREESRLQMLQATVAFIEKNNPPQ